MSENLAGKNVNGEGLKEADDTDLEFPKQHFAIKSNPKHDVAILTSACYQ